MNLIIYSSRSVTSDSRWRWDKFKTSKVTEKVSFLQITYMEWPNDITFDNEHFHQSSLWKWHFWSFSANCFCRGKPQKIYENLHETLSFTFFPCNDCNQLKPAASLSFLFFPIKPTLKVTFFQTSAKLICHGKKGHNVLFFKA